MDNDSLIGKRVSLGNSLARSSTAEQTAVNRQVVGSNPTAPVMPPSSNGQDTGFSHPESEFDSPWRYL